MKILKTDNTGKRRIKITKTNGYLDIHVMRNGKHWVGCQVDDVILVMMHYAIEEYFTLKHSKQEAF